MPNPSKQSPSKKSSAKTPDIKQLMSQLESIVAWFESDDIDIAGALTKYEEGLQTIKKLEQQLAAAKVEVEKIDQRFDA